MASSYVIKLLDEFQLVFVMCFGCPGTLLTRPTDSNSGLPSGHLYFF